MRLFATRNKAISYLCSSSITLFSKGALVRLLFFITFSAISHYTKENKKKTNVYGENVVDKKRVPVVER